MPPFERSTPEEMDGKQKEANQTLGHYLARVLGL